MYKYYILVVLLGFNLQVRAQTGSDTTKGSAETGGKYNGGLISEVRDFDSGTPTSSSDHFVNPYDKVHFTYPKTIPFDNHNKINKDDFLEKFATTPSSSSTNGMANDYKPGSDDNAKTVVKDDFLDSFANAPASQSVRGQDHYFDYDKTNASRFVNSPCFKLLGFDPKANMADQEDRYQKCENERLHKDYTNIIVVGFIVLCIGILVYLAVKKPLSD
jgi:hypothetical protein